MEPVRIKMPVPFAIRTVNAWFFPGPSPALVDCGIGTTEAFDILQAAIPRSPNVYLTHGHVDHAGNAARLAARGATICTPAAETAYVETFRRDSEDRNDRYRDALIRHGMPVEVADKMRLRAGDIDQLTEDCPIGHPLAHQERIALGDAEAIAHHAPGHTPGSVVYELEGAILSGDTLLKGITSNAIELLDEDRGRHRQYVETLAGLSRYIGCTVYPGHHASFELTQAILERHMERHATRAAAIRAALDAPRSAWELMPTIFPNIRPDESFLAMAELVGHLHALEMEGVSPIEGACVRFVR